MTSDMYRNAETMDISRTFQAIPFDVRPAMQHGCHIIVRGGWYGANYLVKGAKIAIECASRGVMRARVLKLTRPEVP